MQLYTISGSWTPATDGQRVSSSLRKGLNTRFPGAWRGPMVTGRRPLLTTRFHEQNAALSPDGRFMAYESDELDGIFEIYVRALREGAAPVRVSTTGGRMPRFSSGGRLYYWHSFGGGLRKVQHHVEGTRFVVDKVASVWEGAEGGERVVTRRFDVTTSAGFDVDASGQRFLMLERSASAPEPPLRRPVVVLNWAEGLRGVAGRP